MSTNYKSSNQEGNFFSNGLLGIAFTALIFVVLPAMHILGQITMENREVATNDASEAPPPPPPEDLPPPPEEQEEQDKPEMEEPPPPMTLSQLEMALNPGAGNAMGDFGFGDFDTGIDALGDMEIFDLRDVDKLPRALFQVEPNYPYSLKQAKIGGYVDLEWVIDVNGRVLKPRVVKSSHREFNQPAIESIMRSKWTPARKDGKPVAVRVKQRMDFNP
jgi:protein TonB